MLSVVVHCVESLANSYEATETSSSDAPTQGSSKNLGDGDECSEDKLGAAQSEVPGHSALGVLVVPANLSVYMAQDWIVRVNAGDFREVYVGPLTLLRAPKPIRRHIHSGDSTDGWGVR